MFRGVCALLARHSSFAHSIDKRVGATRLSSPSTASVGRLKERPDDQMVTPVDLAQKVVSLNHFFDDCRSWKRRAGRSAYHDRSTIQSQFASYWTFNVANSVLLCKTSRDVGFMALFGLSYSGCSLPATCIPPLVHLLIRDKDTTNSLDTASSLRFLSREISRILTQPDVAGSEKDVLTDDFVQMFTNFGMGQVKKFFNPDSSRSLGHGGDIAHFIEFIVTLGNGHPEASRLCDKLFFEAGRQELRMTDLISCFGLLRVCIPKFTPPQTAKHFFRLLKAVKAKDEMLINPFHFVKIIVLLVRIDTRLLRHEGMLKYLVAKSCIFVPNSSPDHQRLLVGSMRKILNDRDMDRLLAPLDAELRQCLPQTTYESLMLGPIRTL